MNDFATRRTNGNPKTQRIFLFFLLICIIFFAIGATLFNHLNARANPRTPLSPLAAATPTPLPQDTALANVVLSALDGTQGSYGIMVKNLTTGEVYGTHEHTIYKSGSLYKLWVMAAVYKKIQDGSLKKTEVLSDDYAELNALFNIDPDYAEETEGTITLSVADALNQMVTISDNYAALLLTEKIKLSTVATFLKDNDLTESKVGTNGNDPTTTSYDVALFLEKLYKGQLANSTYTDEMLNLLKAQKLNTKIPKYLPDDVTVAHKTGELDSFSHDAGIVYGPSGNYILVVLSNSDDTDAADERISEVSKDIYNYFFQ